MIPEYAQVSATLPEQPWLDQAQESLQVNLGCLAIYCIERWGLPVVILMGYCLHGYWRTLNEQHPLPY